MQTIAELPEFLKKSNKLLSDDEKNELIEFLALNPKAGDLIQETGGIRKLRWSIKNKGKSGGVRIKKKNNDRKTPKRYKFADTHGEFFHFIFIIFIKF
jgi:hypothetical protein